VYVHEAVYSSVFGDGGDSFEITAEPRRMCAHGASAGLGDGFLPPG
jgi:hypothetical protein